MSNPRRIILSDQHPWSFTCSTISYGAPSWFLLLGRIVNKVWDLSPMQRPKFLLPHKINMQFQPWIKCAIANSWNLILKMKVEIPSLKFNFINGLVKRSNLNFKYNCSIWSKRNQLALRKKLRKELGPQQPSKYIELPTLGPVYQLWPISTKLLSTSIQNLIIQLKQFSFQYENF